jgi:hypothetical protein
MQEPSLAQDRSRQRCLQLRGVAADAVDLSATLYISEAANDVNGTR